MHILCLFAPLPQRPHRPCANCIHDVSTPRYAPVCAGSFWYVVCAWWKATVAAFHLCPALLLHPMEMAVKVAGCCTQAGSVLPACVVVFSVIRHAYSIALERKGHTSPRGNGSPETTHDQAPGYAAVRCRAGGRIQPDRTQRRVETEQPSTHLDLQGDEGDTHLIPRIVREARIVEGRLCRALWTFDSVRSVGAVCAIPHLERVIHPPRQSA